MIIVLNSFLLILFMIKGFFFKNEFNLVKVALRRVFEYILSVFNIISPSLFSFKKFIKVYYVIKTKSNFFNISGMFKTSIYIATIFSKFKTQWYLLEIFLGYKLNSQTVTMFKLIPSKLNIFLSTASLNYSQEYLKDFQSKYLVEHKPSSFVKYYTKSPLNILFLRKNKIFNKGRYSRNRQLYRTGVYWCIWLSVFLGYCLYFSFYRFTLNFGYQWWLVFFFFFCFFNQKMLKYHLYNFRVVITELFKNFNWVSLFIFNFFKNFLVK